MTPEDWKTYWRTCHLTPFQIRDMELRAFDEVNMWGRRVGRIDPVGDCIDSMEIQMLGIKP